MSRRNPTDRFCHTISVDAPRIFRDTKVLSLELRVAPFSQRIPDISLAEARARARALIPEISRGKTPRHTLQVAAVVMVRTVAAVWGGRKRLHGAVQIGLVLYKINSTRSRHTSNHRLAPAHSRGRQAKVENAPQGLSRLVVDIVDGASFSTARNRSAHWRPNADICPAPNPRARRITLVYPTAPYGLPFRLALCRGQADAFLG
jgi:hypothetical protein